MLDIELDTTNFTDWTRAYIEKHQGLSIIEAFGGLAAVSLEQQEDGLWAVGTSNPAADLTWAEAIAALSDEVAYFAECDTDAGEDAGWALALEWLKGLA